MLTWKLRLAGHMLPVQATPASNSGLDSGLCSAMLGGRRNQGYGNMMRMAYFKAAQYGTV